MSKLPSDIQCPNCGAKTFDNADWPACEECGWTDLPKNISDLEMQLAEKAIERDAMDEIYQGTQYDLYRLRKALKKIACLENTFENPLAQDMAKIARRALETGT